MSVDLSPTFHPTAPAEEDPVSFSSYVDPMVVDPEKQVVVQAEEAIDLDSLVRDEAMIEEPGEQPVGSGDDRPWGTDQHQHQHQRQRQYQPRIQGFEPHRIGSNSVLPQGRGREGGQEAVEYVGVQGYSGGSFDVGTPVSYQDGSNGFRHTATATNSNSISTSIPQDEGSPEVEVVGETGPTVMASSSSSSSKHPLRAENHGQGTMMGGHQHAFQTSAFSPRAATSVPFQHGPPAGFGNQSFHIGSTSQFYPAVTNNHNRFSTMTSSMPPALSAPAPGPGPGPAASPSSSTHDNNNGSAIDLTNDDVASRYSQPTNVQPAQPAQLDMTDRRPVCIGSIDTQALILYPISIMQKGSDRDELVRAGELRVDQGGEEWLKVKLKFRKGKGVGQAPGGDAGNGQAADTVINIMSSKQTVVIGVVNGQVHGMFAPLMGKGLIRLEGYIKRGKLENMFTAVLNILSFTLPSNVTYIADYLANANQFLDHPLPYYIPENHFDSPIYYNPHNPPVEGFRAMRKNRLDAMMGRGAMQQQQQKTIDIQRDQVDQVFMALPSHDDLPETDPGEMIKTKLFPHQLKAITFLQQRENESAAIKAASAAPKEDIEIVDVDAEMSEDEKKKQIKRIKKKAEKDAKKKGVNSLWLPQYDGSGKKIKAWKHLVTDETVKSKEKPVEARGAILADEMGLGKTLSIVSLIASTLPSARKFAHVSAKEEPTDSDGSNDHDGDAGDLDASHFAGSVYGMPSEDGNSKKRKRETGYKFTPDKIAKLERKGRMDRLKLKSRATLLICPLSTVSNWEEQIRDHWRGRVHVVGAAVEKGKKTEKPMPEKGDLKIYIYHGNSRKNDLEFLADFDVVITTFSVLQTEYSKQIKTSEGEKTYLDKSLVSKAAGSSSAATPIASDFGGDDNDSNDLDGYGQGQERPEVRAERLSLQRNSGDTKKKNKNMDMDLFGKKTASEVVSPLQAVEWFRVVLDEAHFIKDPTTVVSRAACYLEAQRRVCLSGTPIQNKLDDIWALFKFLRLAPFDKREVWNRFIMDYAKAGNSLGVVRLQTILKHCTLRRTKDSVNEDGNKILDLPPRREHVVTLKLQDEERKIYDHHFKQGQKQFQEANEDGKVDVVNILQQILRLRQICDHPSLLDTCIAEDLEEEIMADGLMDLDTAKQAIEKDGINLRRALAYIANLRPEEPASCASCQYSFNVAEMVKEDPEGDEPANKTAKGGKRKTKANYPILTRCCHLYCLACFKKLVFPDWPKNALNAGRTCGMCNRALRLGRDVIEVSPGSAVLAEGADGRSKSRRRRKVDDGFQYSSKMLALLQDLLKNSTVNPQSENYDPLFANSDIAEMDENGQPVVTKSVVFSQWTSMLDLLEGMLEKNAIGCARLDGTMKREDRTEAMERLKSDGKCEVLLVSLRAGGVGLNLVAASRCYLIDPYWNPAVEAQAIDRVHRMGQKRNVVAIRYMIEDSIEETMLKIQDRKRELANMSLNQSLSKKELHDRKMDDLREIFKQ